MTIFNRDFASPEAAWADNSGIRHLFASWALPGEPAGRHGLRIGLRDGYLNLYVKGQSVANLTVPYGQPSIQVDPKYAGGIKKGSKLSTTVVDQSGRLQGDEITPDAIDRLIETAETYAVAEKRFVDDLVWHNAGVIDLEVGLPGRTAPRMDLAVIQTGDRGLEIAFWEAKCSDHKALRSVSEYQEDERGGYLVGPEVIHQLRKYQRWMAPEELPRVATAYRRVANLLGRLADRFGKDGASRTLWREIADGQSLSVILPPGVVVGNYCPAGHDGKKTGAGVDIYAHRATSFGKYCSIIEKHGATVHEVGSPDQAVLPPLASGTVTALPA